jgi:hypothetical protein
MTIASLYARFCMALAISQNGVAHRSQISDGDRRPTIRTFTNEEYLKNLPNRKQTARERMWNPDVRIRGSIANVWTLLQVQSSKFKVQSLV